MQCRLMLRSEVTFSQLTEHGERDLLRHRVAHSVVRGAGVPGDTSRDEYCDANVLHGIELSTGLRA